MEACQFHVRQSVPDGSVLAAFHSPDSHTAPVGQVRSGVGSALAPE